MDRLRLFRPIRLISLLLIFSATGHLASAADYDFVPSDTIRLGVNFAQGRHELHFGDNMDRIAAFTAAVDSVYEKTPYRIVIHSSASPEGGVRNNYILSRNRGNALGAYLRSHLRHRPDTIIIIPHGEDWDGLDSIVAGLDTTWRDDVLAIIRSDADTLSKKRSIRALEGGRVWNWLLKYKYPSLRRATNALCMPARETAFLPRLACAAPELKPPLEPLAVRRDSVPEKRRGIAVAVKTNLLSDVMLAPNVEVEFPFNERWSLAVDWTFPWWLFKHNSYCEELLGGTVQGRRYFGDRAARRYFTGWFAGVYAGLGYYDFQVPSKGIQGEYAHAGIAGGYSKRLGEYFNLEFEIGIGGLLTQYRKYIPKENHTVLLYRETFWTTWFGPTRAKVSLVWRLGKKCRSDR